MWPTSPLVNRFRATRRLQTLAMTILRMAQAGEDNHAEQGQIYASCIRLIPIKHPFHRISTRSRRRLRVTLRRSLRNLRSSPIRSQLCSSRKPYSNRRWTGNEPRHCTSCKNGNGIQTISCNASKIGKCPKRLRTGEETLWHKRWHSEHHGQPFLAAHHGVPAQLLRSSLVRIHPTQPRGLQPQLLLATRPRESRLDPVPSEKAHKFLIWGAHSLPIHSLVATA